MALIDREALKRDLVKYGVLEMVVGIIDRQPEIKPVITLQRCGKCEKYFYGWCLKYNCYRLRNDFCIEEN